MSMYVWGCNKSKQLLGVSALHSYTPSHCSLPNEEAPLQIAAGDEHTMILSESGDVYAYGSNKDGQLGTGTYESGKKVLNLDNETIVAIAAGAHTSYAVTANGTVYHWGLIHRDTNPSGQDTDQGQIENVDNMEEAQAGRLTGMAQDQDNVIIEQDQEERQRSAVALSRRERAEAAASHRGHHRDVRTLREVVRESTERWLLSSDDADQEYYEELRAMGYHVEEMEEMVQGRGREYHGMIKMGCIRYMQKSPLKVGLPDKVFISSVSSGYAHVMLLSRSGLLYAAGYNDRGQLGLGHRINTSSFKLVDFLANKFVVEVSCGQQHTICRAVDRSAITSNDSRVFVNSDIGADAYVWGIGILGQLGLGRRGTTKGRLLPTINPTLHHSYPNGIISVSAGANFTAVVTIKGEVFSFGHAEYNQHGTGNISTRDYVDPYYYFEPRVVNISFDDLLMRKLYGNTHHSKQSNQSRVRIRSVTCGGIFTVAIDEFGDLYTWGWNESGVLGHGIAYFSAAPKRIDSVGFTAQNTRIRGVSCGNKHVIVTVESLGNSYARSSMQHLLSSSNSMNAYYDAELVIDLTEKESVGLVSKYGTIQGHTIRYPCHRALLAARSTYLQGYIRAAEKELALNEGSSVLTILLTGKEYNEYNMKALLEYLYLDKIPTFATFASIQRMKELVIIAQELGIPPLSSALGHSVGGNIHVNPHPVALALNNNNAPPKPPKPAAKYQSSFVTDMLRMLESNDYADVVFTLKVKSTTTGNSASAAIDDSEKEYLVSFGNKFILTRILYLETIFRGEFADCKTYYSMSECLALDNIFDNKPHRGHNMHQYFHHSMLQHHVTQGIDEEGKKKMLKIDISGILQDDMDVETFMDMIYYIYTGQSKILDQLLPSIQSTIKQEEVTVQDKLSQVMALLITTNRVGFSQLAQQCERTIALYISNNYHTSATSDTVDHVVKKKDVSEYELQRDHIESCLSFAQHYNFSLLEQLCYEILR